MRLSEAIAAIEQGHEVTDRAGFVYWLEADAKGRPVLMGKPADSAKPVKHLVFSSEHFHEDWSIAP